MIKTIAKGTLYLRGEFMGNIHKIEARDIMIETGVKYAQYDNAIRVTWTPKGARRARGTVLTYRPFCVALDGWGHLDPDSMFGKATETETGVLVSHGRHSACSGGWQSDFLVQLAVYLETSGASIAYDAATRGTP